jgi:hypothetical protein
MPKKYTLRKRMHRKHSGGGSDAYTFGAPIVPGGPDQEVVRMSACQAVPRGGEIASYSPPFRGGLPGMAGGGRRYKKWTLKQLKRLHKKRGGGWTVDTAKPLGGPNVLLDNTKIPACTWGGGRKRKGKKSMRGGASLLGSPDLAAYAAPTAGYTNVASSFTDSVGAPILLQQPYEARTMNPACIKTGGGTRKATKKRRARKSKSMWKFW